MNERCTSCEIHHFKSNNESFPKVDLRSFQDQPTQRMKAPQACRYTIHV